MEDSIKQIEALTGNLSFQVKELIQEAYTRGWDAGVASTPDYKEFNERHQEPQFYGEDGEIVVIAGSYGMEQAVDEIYKALKDDFDVTRDEVWSNTHGEKVALATADDESDYYVGKNRDGVFPAWVWRA